MTNTQGTTLAFLFAAFVLFFFSLTLLPPAEMYCRFRRPATILGAVQVVLLLLRIKFPAVHAERSLLIATYCFVIIGIVFNIILLTVAHGRCA